MHCLTFAIVLVIFLLSIPLYLQFLQNNMRGRKSGMIGYRQIRDDPNHTCYAQNTFGDFHPNTSYGNQPTLVRIDSPH
jgi:hypothetical protein